MKSAREFWKEKFEEYPQTDADKLAVAMMSEYGKENKHCTGKEFECELSTMLENIPQNRPIYKDSGLWQIRTDDMEDVIFQQSVEESFFDFIKRAYEKENSFMSAFED